MVSLFRVASEACFQRAECESENGGARARFVRDEAG